MGWYATKRMWILLIIINNNMQYSMKKLQEYVLEDFTLKKKGKINKDGYNYHPKDKDKLRSLIKQLLKERGKDAGLNDIDASDITDMSYLFYNLDPHNIDISEWDVSNVINMNGMFYNCKNFNSDLSGWDVSSVEDMQWMFYGCKNFTGHGLEKWTTVKCKEMFNMFNGCKNFNSDLSKWDVSNVQSTTRMFKGCTSLSFTNTPSWYK